MVHESQIFLSAFSLQHGNFQSVIFPQQIVMKKTPRHVAGRNANKRGKQCKRIAAVDATDAKVGKQC
jgi:hypothetical protein